MFNIFKVLEIKFTYENQLNRLLINSVWINLVSLASVYFSLDSLLKGDMWVLPFYIGGSVLGKWVAMTQMDNTEFKLFSLFKSKTEKQKKNERTKMQTPIQNLRHAYGFCQKMRSRPIVVLCKLCSACLKLKNALMLFEK